MHQETWAQRFCRHQRLSKSLIDTLRLIAKPHKLSSNDALLLLLCYDQATTPIEPTIPTESESGTGLAQTDITRRSSMSPAAVSGNLESLRKKKLIESDTVSKDRRKKSWCITSDGKSIAMKMSRLLSVIDDSAMEEETSTKTIRREAA